MNPDKVFDMIICRLCIPTPYTIHITELVKYIKKLTNETSLQLLFLIIVINCGSKLVTVSVPAAYPTICSASGSIMNLIVIF